MNSAIIGIAALISVATTPVSQEAGFLIERPAIQRLVTDKSLDLTNRTPSVSINEGFADNMLLSLHYLKGDAGNPRSINWDEIRKPFEVSFTLFPGEVFAFHDNVMPKYANPQYTLKSKFVTNEGYKFVNGLGGNGVCHLATLINWAAKEANLEVTAPANHDFYPVVGIPRENGTAIMSTGSTGNLYVKNNKDNPVTFVFDSTTQKIELKIVE